jgi:hypothetical protein
MNTCDHTRRRILMIQNLAKMVAIVVLSVTPLIGSGAAHAHDMSSSSAGLDNAEWHGGGWHGGFYPYYHGGYYPGYYGHGPCYLTVYGTTYCY